MTRNHERRRTYILPVFITISTVYLLLCSDTAGEAASGALNMCGAVIIPSLFPNMVISSMLVRTGAAAVIGSWMARPIRAIFRLPGCAGGAVVLGALCGFPVGAKTACELYEQNALTRAECERLIAIANNTGPSFVIEVVGAHFWGSRGMGVVIYLAQILSAVLLGFVTSRRKSKPRCAVQFSEIKCDILECLSASVSHSAASVVSVCGFIVFFAVVTSLVGQILTNIQMHSVAPILGALLEFSAGASAASESGGIWGAFLTGFTVGWSGISVFAQCKAFTAKYGISLRFAACCKAFQGLMTGTVAAIYYVFWFTPSATVCAAISHADLPDLLIAGELLFLAAASLHIPRKST